MKRVLCLSLLFTILCALLTFTPAAAATYGDLSYINCGDHIEITGCEISVGSIDIPAEIDGIPVTSISSLGSYYRINLTSINIPDSVTSIAYDAFRNCYNLLNITVAVGNQNYCDINGVLFNKYKTEIYTFPRGKIQSEYTIPDGVTSIGSYAFYKCENLTNINIPSSVTSIGRDAFSDSGYYNNKANWENDILYIGDCLIRGYKNDYPEKDITVRSGTRIIADNAFNFDGYKFVDDFKTISIYIPDSVAYIGKNALNGYNIKNIDIDIENNSYYSEDGNLYDKNKHTLIRYASGKKEDNFNVPEGVENIADSAFSDCNLSNITLPDSVISIGDSAFGASKLKSINIPEGITSIGQYVFSHCLGLTNINIPNNVTNIGESAFFYCMSLKSINIPNSVTIIGNSAFSYSGLTDVYYSGTQEEWKRLEIEGLKKDDEPLLNANIHFNYNKPGMSESEIIRTNDAISVTTNIDNISAPEEKQKSEVFVVLYDENGAVIDSYSAVYDGSEISGDLKNDAKADHIKVFVWNKDGSLEPITTVPEHISIGKNN